MGWIAIAFICVIFLFLVVYVFSRRHNKKSASHRTTTFLPPKRLSKETEDSRVEPIEETFPEKPKLPILKDTDDRHEQDEQQRISKEATPYGQGAESTRTHVRYDWQKRFEESILTPFPEEWSPALHYLYEAHKLEEEGADQEKVQKVLEKAHEADKDATAFYLGRMSIIKKVQSERQRDR